MISSGFILNAKNNSSSLKIKKSSNTTSVDPELKKAVITTATISGTATVCQNAVSQVTFEGTGGTIPYTFTYNINGSPTLTVTTQGTDTSVTVDVNTSVVTTLNYNLISAHDATTPIVEVPSSGMATVTIIDSPEATLGGTGSGGIFNGLPVFKSCTNTNSTFTFTNTSNTTASNTNYTINWGDGTPDFTASTWTSVSHTYAVGLHNIIYTIVGSNGCETIKNYLVFVGSNPAVSLGNPGSTDICNLNSLTFPITGTQNNPSGTIYTVTFNDGSPAEVFNHPPPANVTHTFTSPSCGITSSDGTNSYPNSFSAIIVASNPCNISSVGVVPIYVSSPPKADFTIPTVACTNTAVTIINTSLGSNDINSGVCDTNAKKVWTISPATGFTIASGSLGNDFGSTDSNLWQTGSNTLNVNFTQPGTYSVTIKTANKCNVDSKTQQICIEAPLVPTFSIDTPTGCTPQTVNITNTTNPSGACSPPTYLWNVTYAASNCGTAPATWNYTGGTSATSTSPSFNFVTPGTYNLTLSTTNSCGTVVSPAQTVVIKKPPTVSINTIASLCGPGSITPVATVNGCAPTSSTLQYLWNFPGGSPANSTSLSPGPISYATEGTYTVSLSVTNECGTTVATDQNFTINPIPIVANSSLDQTVCSGNPTSLVSLTSNPTGATFTWTASATSGITGFTPSGTNTIPIQTITTTATSPGTVTYVITPRLNGCTGSPTNYIITVNPAPTITAQPSPSTICIGGTPTPLSFTISGSTGTPTYQWYSNSTNSNTGGTVITGQNNPTFTPPNSPTGTIYYYNEITFPTGGCSLIKTNAVAVIVRPNISINNQPNPTQNLCVGVTIPTALSITTSGGTGTTTYQWYSNTTNSNSGGNTISGATNSSYSPPVFTTAGDYYYYVIATPNGNGCLPVTSDVAEVKVFSDPTITIQPLASQSICRNTTPTNLAVAATGGNGTFSYQWYSNNSNSNSGGTLISGATNNNYIPPTTTVGTKYYYAIVKQATAGCEVTSAVAGVTVIASPTITTQPASSTVCQGGSPTLLSVSYSNGIGTPSYQWFSNSTNSNSGGISILGGTNSSYLPPSTTVGTTYYYSEITLSSGGCSSLTSNTATVAVTAGITINNQPTPTQSLCVGGTIPTALTVTTSGGAGSFTYQWYESTTNTNSSGNSISGATNSSYLPPVFNSTGNYYYYVVVTPNGNGCAPIKSDVAEITVENDPIVSTQPLASQSLCQGSTPTNLTVVATGGIGTFSYQWYSSTTNSNTSGNLISGQNNSTFTPPTTTVGTRYYYATISQSGVGCATKSNVSQVIVNLAPSINTQPQSTSICLGQPLSPLTVSYSNGAGTASFQWFSNSTNSNSGGTPISGATSATFSPPNTSIGTNYYYCEITFTAGGCSLLVSNTATIVIQPYPVISNKTAIICSGNIFTINPNNLSGDTVPTGTTYTWTTPTSTPSGVITGASSQTTPRIIIEQTLINSATSPATVTYTVTPSAGTCIGSNFTVTVTVNPSITVTNTTTNSNCYGANNGSIQINTTGGIPFSSGAPYIYNWTGPNGYTSTLSNIANLAPGNYDLSITDNGGCPTTKSYTINEPNDISITTDLHKDISCFNAADGKISISVSGGTPNYTYNWTKNGLPFSTLEDLTGLDSGIYVVSVSDANSCGPKTASFTIIEPPILAVNLVSKTDVLCAGQSTGAITINVTGGTSSYSYAWTGPNGFTSNTQNLSNIAAGNYNLIVTDFLNCTKTLSITINQPSEIIITPTVTPIICYGDDNGSIRIAVTGGNAPYTITWSNLATGDFQDNLSPGDYLITVTDNSNCTKSLNVNIPDVPIFSVNPVVKHVRCFGENNGSINLNFVGGIAPVRLTWDDNATAGTVRNNLGPGTYIATIIDSKPCTIRRSFTILEPQPIVISANTTDALDCNIVSSGEIILLVSGGTAPYTYLWSNGATTKDLVNIPAGNYLVIVEDANGCSSESSFRINRPAPIVTNVVNKTDVDCDTKSINQNYVAQVSGGVPPYDITWSSGTVSGANNEIMNTNINGTAILYVTDAVGCKSNYSFNVDLKTIGTPSNVTNSYAYTTYGNYSIQDPIQFTNTSDGDYISMIWDFGDGAFSTEINPVHTYVNPKDYVVTQTVAYPYGCSYEYKITLTVGKGYVLVVPNAFTPNNDNLNDAFRPVTKGLKNIKLDIYDTWGSMIYSETADVLKGWNGLIKGFKAENGNYYCKVSGETFYGTIVNANHPFVLIK